MAFNLLPYFGNKQPELHALFQAQDRPLPGRADKIAGLVPISLGVKMMVAQAMNEGLRHCRIGMVRPRT